MAIAAPTSVCVVNDVDFDASGTTQCDGGDSDINVPLRSNVFLTGDHFTMATPPDIPGVQPCPLCDRFCSISEMPCNADSDCPATQTCPVAPRCLGGPNDGDPCTPATSSSTVLGDTQNAFPTSHDCPPAPSLSITDGIGGLPIGFTLTTGTITRNAADLNTGIGGRRVFAGFCRDSLGAGSLCFEGDTDISCTAAIPSADGNAVPGERPGDVRSDFTLTGERPGDVRSDFTLTIPRVAPWNRKSRGTVPVAARPGYYAPSRHVGRDPRRQPTLPR
jgi:hypothetical protein